MNPASESAESISNFRWSRTTESDDFFSDADKLRGCFYLLVAAGGGLLGLLAAGLWQLQASALTPPIIVGIAHGQIFSGPPETLASVREDDFDAQLADTVEVLFGRTEKGQPPEIRDYCAPEVVAGVSRAYQDAASKYPAGYVQTLAIMESKVAASRTGYRHMLYRGLLSSRSVAASQTSPVYLDCTFLIGPPTALNATGWRLVRVEAMAREEYYRQERERAVREALSLLPAAGTK